jgi:hypothetical protein
MTRLTRSSGMPAATPTGARLLSRILDEPELGPIVRSLDAPTLVGLVRHVGLEDAGEIVALATPEQIESMFDEDLWRSSRTGADETFDPLRFALWLEVLLEADPAQAIDKMAKMDEDFLALAIARHVLVLDLDALAHDMRALDEDEQTQLDKALADQPHEELEEFRVVARDARTFEPVAALLLGLDQDHHALLRRLLERVAAATSERIDDEGGLYEVLGSDEMLEDDVAGARENRRERAGFVSPSQAAAFLRLCLVTPLAELRGATERDPVQRAAARAAAPPGTVDAIRAPLTPRARAFLTRVGGDGTEQDAARTAPRLGTADDHEIGATQAGLGALRDRDPTRFSAGLEDLAFLVNVVVAACGGARFVHPSDATAMALAVCDVGLAELAKHLAVAPEDVLVRRELAPAFRIGWHLRGSDPWSIDTFRRFTRAKPVKAERAATGDDPRARASRGRSGRARRA